MEDSSEVMEVEESEQLLSEISKPTCSVDVVKLLDDKAVDLKSQKGSKRVADADDIELKNAKFDGFPNRNKLRGKRRVAKLETVPEEGPLETFAVLDTNVFMSHVDDLKRLLTKSSQNPHIIVKYVVPWVVLQELDGLKKGRNGKVQDAVKFINQQLQQGSSFTSDIALIRKFSSNSDEDPLEIIEQANLCFNTCNDDVLLKQCLTLNQLKKEKGFNVLLVSDDVNLRNKALAADLKAQSWPEFSFEMFRTNPSNLLKSILERSQSDTIAESAVPIIPAKLRDAMVSQNKCVTPPKPRENVQPSVDCIEMNDPTGNTESSDSDDPQKKLAKFVEQTLRMQYGEKLWNKMFTIDVKTASLLELFKTIKKGWIGSFSDVFNRSSEVMKEIEKIIEELKNSNTNRVALRSVSSFLKKLPKISFESHDSPHKSAKRRRTD